MDYSSTSVSLRMSSNKRLSKIVVVIQSSAADNNYGSRSSTVVKVLCYKSEGRWFDSFRSHYGPGVDSESATNEYQEYFLGVKTAGA